MVATACSFIHSANGIRHLFWCWACDGIKKDSGLNGGPSKNMSISLEMVSRIYLSRVFKGVTEDLEFTLDCSIKKKKINCSVVSDSL